jgi:hypothetical protein
MGIIAESNEQREKRIQRRLNTCVHHNGYFHKVCDAGVLYESVGEQIDLGNLGRPFVAACIKNYEWNGQALECQHICALSQFPTRQQVEEDLERQEAAFAQHITLPSPRNRSADAFMPLNVGAGCIRAKPRKDIDYDKAGRRRKNRL